MKGKDYQDGEINLTEYIKIIMKRKKIIFGILFISVIAGVIVGFSEPKVYIVEAKIKEGNLSGSLISEDFASQMLIRKNVIRSVLKKANIDVKGFRGVKIENIKGTGLFKFTVYHVDPDLIAKTCNTIVDDFISEGNKLYEKRENYIKIQLQELEGRSKIIASEISKLREVIIKRQIEPIFPLLYNTLTNYNYEKIYTDLRGQIYSFKKELLNSQRFEIFEVPSKSDYSFQSKKWKRIAIFVISGLMLGVFMALFREFWEKSKLR